MKKYVAILLTVLLIGTMTGCSSKSNSKNSSGQTETTEDKNGNDLEMEMQWVSEEEALGVLGLKECPKTVVATTYAAADLVNQVGGTLVGVPDEFAADHSDLKDVKTVGPENEINYEALADLKADLYIFDGAKKDEIEPNVKDLGIPVYFANLHYVNTVYTNIQVLGVTCGNQEAMKKLFYQYLDDQQAALSVANGKQTQNVLLLKTDKSGVYMSDNSTYFGDMIAKVGGINVVAEMGLNKEDSDHGYYTLDVDAILASNPSAIFIFNQGAKDPVAAAKKAFGDKWETMIPVQNNDITILDDSYSRGGLDNIDYMKSIVDIIYGDQEVVVK